jgi:hypothetical protein
MRFSAEYRWQLADQPAPRRMVVGTGWPRARLEDLLPRAVVAFGRRRAEALRRRR